MLDLDTTRNSVARPRLDMGDRDLNTLSPAIP